MSEHTGQGEEGSRGGGGERGGEDREVTGPAAGRTSGVLCWATALGGSQVGRWAVSARFTRHWRVRVNGGDVRAGRDITASRTAAAAAAVHLPTCVECT